MNSSTLFSIVLAGALAASPASQAQVARHGYAEILARPAPALAAAAAATPETPHSAIPAAAVAAPAPPLAAAFAAPESPRFRLSDQVKLALDAARLDADAKLAVVRNQRARGRLDDEAFQAQMVQYEGAVQAYDALSAPGAEIEDEAQADALKLKLLDFNASGSFRSVLADVDVRRGEDGTVLAERSSLETSVTESVDALRATLPADQDTRPAQAYLDALQTKTLNRIRAQSATSDAISFADATVMVLPVQETQALMSGPAPSWNIKVNMTTSPASAVVVFFTQSGYYRNFVTDSSKTVMRGLLEYVVYKPGYKTVRGKELDLVSAVLGKFTCTLVPQSQPDPPLPCQID